MSRIGKKNITVSKEISVTKTDSMVHVKGPKGSLDVAIPEAVDIVVKEGAVEVKLKDENAKNMQGLIRSILQNAIFGVKDLWTKTLELVGVGFRAETNGHDLTLSLGYSHPVKIIAPPNITFSVAENKITVSGVDKYLVGEVAAGIKRLKKPDPYKGKGIRYAGEYIRKKIGKAAKAVGGAGAK